MWFIHELYCNFLISGYRLNGARGFALSQPFLIGSCQEINLWKWFPQPLRKLVFALHPGEQILKNNFRRKSCCNTWSNNVQKESFLHRVMLSGTTSLLPGGTEKKAEAPAALLDFVVFAWAAFWSAAFIRGVTDDETLFTLQALLELLQNFLHTPS